MYVCINLKLNTFLHCALYIDEPSTFRLGVNICCVNTYYFVLVHIVGNMSENRTKLSGAKNLTAEEEASMERQNSRIVNEFKANQLEVHAQKHWDLFYKRNETRFFKDRHWTTREFGELISVNADNKCLLEVGCGVGNFVFPLIKENFNKEYFIYACDFSARAISLLQKNQLYDETMIKAFQCDITTDAIFDTINENTVDIISLIFVLSAIHPNKFEKVFCTLFRLLKPGGLLLFRDYGLNDTAQIRFKPGNKIADNFYMRQDGTRSYYFTVEQIDEQTNIAGYKTIENTYIHRKTINIKENIDKDRIFVQGKFRKPIVQ